MVGIRKAPTNLIYYILLGILMKVFKTEEHPLIVTLLNHTALTYSRLGQNEKAMEINEKVYSKK